LIPDSRTTFLTLSVRSTKSISPFVEKVNVWRCMRNFLHSPALLCVDVYMCFFEKNLFSTFYPLIGSQSRQRDDEDLREPEWDTCAERPYLRFLSLLRDLQVVRCGLEKAYDLSACFCVCAVLLKITGFLGLLIFEPVNR